MVGVGAFDALQSTTPRASAATKAPSKRKSTSASKSQGRGKCKSKDLRTDKELQSQLDSACGIAKWVIVRDCPNCGSRDEDPTNLKRAFA